MAELVLRFEVDGPGAIVRSLLSVCEVLAASGRARKTLVDCFPDLAGAELDSGAPHLILDRFALFVGEPVLDIAGGAVNDRRSVVECKRLSVRVGLGGLRHIPQKIHLEQT